MMISFDATWLVLAAGVAVAVFGMLGIFASGFSTNIQATRKAEAKGLRLILAGALIFTASWLI